MPLHVQHGVLQIRPSRTADKPVPYDGYDSPIQVKPSQPTDIYRPIPMMKPLLIKAGQKSDPAGQIIPNNTTPQHTG